MKPYSLTDYTNLPVDSAALTSFFMLIFDCSILFWHPFTSMTVLLSINFQCRQLITRCIWRRTPWLTLGGTEGCCLVPRCCLALLMDRWSSWTAMAECWPTCSFMSQTESSTCPGTTPASWWRTAARATPTPTTIPHHKVGWCAHPPVSALLLLMKTSPMPGRCHALQNQQGFVSSSSLCFSTVSSSRGAESWYGRVGLLYLCCSASICTNEITTQSSISFQWGWVKNSGQGHVRFHW